MRCVLRDIEKERYLVSRLECGRNSRASDIHPGAKKDIAKVVIPRHPFITLAGSGEQGEAAMVLHMMPGELKIIANPEDAEAVLTWFRQL